MVLIETGLCARSFLFCERRVTPHGDVSRPIETCHNTSLLEHAGIPADCEAGGDVIGIDEHEVVACEDADAEVPDAPVLDIDVEVDAHAVSFPVEIHHLAFGEERGEIDADTGDPLKDIECVEETGAERVETKALFEYGLLCAIKSRANVEAKAVDDIISRVEFGTGAVDVGGRHHECCGKCAEFPVAFEREGIASTEGI